MYAALRFLSISLAAAALTGLVSQPALAVVEADFQFDRTEDLVHVCSVAATEAEYVASSLACTAFLEATVQYHDASTAHKKGKALVCVPPKVTVADVRQIFLDWANQNKNNQKYMAELPVNGVMRALAAKYPCKAQ